MAEILVLGHDDLAAELYWRRKYGETGALAARLGEYRAAGVGAIVSSVFVQPELLPEQGLRAALGEIDALEEEIALCGGRARLVRTAAALDAALGDGALAVVLSLEGAEPLGADEALLRVFHRLGVSILGLTWNGRNAAADGCHERAGLTGFGRTLLREAASLGMALDVSHLDDAGFSEALGLFPGPVLASHSNCRALTAHPRNLTDGQIAALAARDGVIGLNQINFLAARPGSSGTADDLRAHLARLLALAGPEHVGLGPDFARRYAESVPKPRALRESDEEEDILPDYAALAALTEGAPEGVRGGNFLRFLRRALP
jgi:membrane dipeptidase